MANKLKRDSDLVQAVLALDSHLSELERVGARITATDMSSDVDVEFIQRLINRFAEGGQAVAQEVANLSARLQEVQARAETVAQGVSRQAELFKRRLSEYSEKLEKFRILGEKVRQLTAAVSQFRRPQGLTNEDRAQLTSSLPGFEAQLTALIAELQDLLKSARESRMKTLEKNAQSLAQTLEAVRKKLSELSLSKPNGSTVSD